MGTLGYFIGTPIKGSTFWILVGVRVGASGEGFVVGVKGFRA